jgi:hypothetical protein
MGRRQQVIPDLGRVDVGAIYGWKHKVSLRGSCFSNPNYSLTDPVNPDT